MTEPVVEIPFAAGINESDRDELVDAARAFTRLENVRQRKRGAVGKRYAYTSLGTALLDGTDRTDARRLFSNGDQICVVTRERIEVYSETLECSVPRGSVPEATYAFFEAPSVAPEAIVADVAYVNGFIAIATYAVSDEADVCLFVSILDATTYAVVRGPEVVSSDDVTGGYGLAVLGTTVYVAHCSNVTDELKIYKLDTASAATITAGWSLHLTITATDCTRQMAIASYSDRIAVAFDRTSGSARVRIRTFNGSGLLESYDHDTGGVSPEIATLDISEGSGTLWVCWVEGVELHAMGLDPSNIDGTPLATDGLILASFSGYSQASITATGASSAVVCALSAVDAYPVTATRSLTIDGGAATPEDSGGLYYNAFLRSRPFLRDGKVYAWFTSSNYEEIVLCELVTNIGPLVPGSNYLRPVVAPLVRGLVDATVSRINVRCRTAAVDSYAYAFAFGSKKTGLTDGTLALALDFDDPNCSGACEHFGSTFLAGGVTTIFDGSFVFESGFLCAPPSPLTDTSASGSMTFTNGGRCYVAVYATVDADGNLHVSGVSNPSTITGNIASKQVDVYVLPLEITMRGALDASDFGSAVQVFLYATTDGGEAPYHYVGSAQNPPGGYLASPVIIEDTLSDASLSARALLYGSGNLPGTVVGGQPGGPQDHRAPPGLTCLVSYNGTLCGISGREVWQCSQPVYGEGVWWSPIFTAQASETLTALFVADGTLYATSRRGVFAVTGEPPNDTGTSGGLAAPRKLAIDRGCISARSVCVTNIGTFLQSERGLELFRQGAMDPIGDNVAETLEAYPVVTSAVLDVPRGLVRIALASGLQPGGMVEAWNDEAGQDMGGRDLIFDLVLGVWISVDIKRTYEASQDAALVTLGGRRVYAWLSADGPVWVEDDASFLDDEDTWISMVAETGWVRIAGINGEQFMDRVLLLAKSLTSHDLAIEIAFDYSDTYTSAKTFTSDQIEALTRAWLDREVIQTTSQAIRLRFTDATPTGDDAEIGTGEGGTWIAVSFNGQPHRGAKRTSGAQRGG